MGASARRRPTCETSPRRAISLGFCSSQRRSSSLTGSPRPSWLLAFPLGEAIPVIPRVLRITHWTNEGAAFSLFADSASPNAVRWGLIAFSAIAAVAVLIALIRLGNRISLATIALALVLAGALGNLHDRIVYGSVVDFIEVHIFGYHWPDFNVADSSHRRRSLPAASRFPSPQEILRIRQPR